MYNTFQIEFGNMEQEIRKDTLHKAIDALFERQFKIETVLQNGRPIFEQSHGAKFDRIYEKRMELHMIHRGLNRAVSTLIELMNKE